MITRIPYGRGSVALDLRGFRIHPLTPTYPRQKSPIAELVLEALDHPVAGSPLREMARGRSSALLVVPDATRKAALPEILPVIIALLQSSGVKRIEVLLACGTHPPVDSTALQTLLGDLPEAITVSQHDSRDLDQLRLAGRFVDGSAIRLNRRVFEADLLLTIGALRHHYFAGFGGGPKMIFPGVAGYEEIQHNHSRVIEFASGLPKRHEACEPGQLEGNPVAEEIAAAADLKPPDMALSLIPGPGTAMSEVYAGPWRPSFARAVERVREIFELSAPPFELMVACGGGFPSDDTLIQAHKGLDAACRFLSPGGKLLYLAPMSSGAGSPEMLPFLEDAQPDTILRSLARTWVQYGHTTLRILEKTAGAKIHLFSELDRRLVSHLGFERVIDIGDHLETWRKKYSGKSIGLMVGDAVYPRRIT